MNDFRKRLAALRLILVVLALGACSESDQGPRAVARFELLERVPADTPYVAASSRRLPESLSVRMLRAAAMNSRSDAIRDALDAASGGDEGWLRFLRLTQALNDELEGHLTPQGVADLGFPLNGRSLIYGLGILPVTWIETETPAKVQAFLDRVEERAGVHSRPRKLGEIAWRRFDFGELIGVRAQLDGYLVAGLIPRESENELLPLVLGERKPEKSLAASGAFLDFTARHGFLGYGEGYLDLVRFVEMVLGEAGGVNARVLQALGGESEPVSPACRRLARRLVRKVPRVGFGFTEAKADRYTMEMVVESAPEVGAWLKQLDAPVPGLGNHPGALLDFGLGLNLPLLRDGIKSLIAYTLEQGKGCGQVDEDSLRQTSAMVEVMLSPALAGIKGFDFTLEEIEMDPRTLEPASVDARFVLSATDPRGVFGMLAMINPRMALLQIPADGTPVQLPLKDMAPGAPPAWVAIKGEALGIFLGSKAPGDPARVLGAPPASPAPLFAFNYNVKKLLAEVGPALERNLAGLQGEEAQSAREAYETLKQTAALYDQLDFRILGAGEGLRLRGAVRFNDEPEK